MLLQESPLRERPILFFWFFFLKRRQRLQEVNARIRGETKKSRGRTQKEFWSCSTTSEGRVWSSKTHGCLEPWALEIAEGGGGTRVLQNVVWAALLPDEVSNRRWGDYDHPETIEQRCKKKRWSESHCFFRRAKSPYWKEKSITAGGESKRRGSHSKKKGTEEIAAVGGAMTVNPELAFCKRYRMW